MEAIADTTYCVFTYETRIQVLHFQCSKKGKIRKKKKVVTSVWSPSLVDPGAPASAEIIK